MFSELKQACKKIIMEKLGFEKQLSIDGYEGDDWTHGVYHIFQLDKRDDLSRAF